MARMHIHIAVEDIAKNIAFYSALFGAQPSVNKDDYAKWQLENPKVNFAISTHGRKPGLDHVGIQSDSPEEQTAIEQRLKAAEITGAEQKDTTCCYARSDKYWTVDPQGIPWETFHTLASAPTFTGNEQREESGSGCCVPGLSSCC